MNAQPSVVIRPAEPVEAEALTALAISSKAVWGYDENFMAACRAELTVTPDLLEADHAFVAHVDGHRAGFYTLEHLDDEEVELGFLSVEPGMQRLGIGRQLVDHAGSTASDLGYLRLVIVGDPHAEDFYRAMVPLQSVQHPQ